MKIKHSKGIVNIMRSEDELIFGLPLGMNGEVFQEFKHEHQDKLYYLRRNRK